MKTILVADKNDRTRNLIRLMLTEDMGYSVVATSSGRDVVFKAEQIKPDIVLVDVYLPDKDGYEVSREIKGNLSLKNTPVVLMTSAFTTLDRAKIAEARADDFITKPLNSDEMIEKVQSLTTKNKNRIKVLIRTKIKNETHLLNILVSLLVIVLVAIPIVLSVINLKPKTEIRTIDADGKEKEMKLDIANPDQNEPQPIFEHSLFAESEISGIEAYDTSNNPESLIKTESTNETSTMFKEDKTDVKYKTTLEPGKKKRRSKSKSVRKTGEKESLEKLVKIDLKRETAGQEVGRDSFTPKSVNTEEESQELNSISRELELASMEDVRYKLWNSSRGILGPEGVNSTRVNPSRKENRTENRYNLYTSGLKITDWSYYEAMGGLAIINNVKIENSSNITYKNVKVSISYYSRYGTEVSWQTGILPVTVPPHSKRTYLKEGIVILAGLGDMDARDLEILDASPVP